MYSVQEPLYLGKTALLLIWFRMVSTQIITQVYKGSLTLRNPPNINIILTGITSLTPVGGFFTTNYPY